MNRNKKGQFAKEEPYSRLASLLGFIVIVAGISVIGLNLYRQNKKIEQVEIKQEQQIVEIKEVKEEFKEYINRIKEWGTRFLRINFPEPEDILLERELFEVNLK